jgi:hypothetical protein
LLALLFFAHYDGDWEVKFVRECVSEMLIHNSFEGGVFGFAAFEAWTAYKAQVWQERWGHVWFWVIRLVMCVVAGVFAETFDPNYPMLAIGIGFSTPSLPSLMTTVLKNMISALEHTDLRGVSPDLDVPNVFDQPSDSVRPEDEAISEARDNESTQKYDDQPVGSGR